MLIYLVVNLYLKLKQLCCYKPFTIGTIRVKL